MGKGAEVADLEQWEKHHFRLKVEVGSMGERMVIKSSVESEHQHLA